MQDSQFSQSMSELQNLLDQNQDVGIVIGEHHTIDKIGASLALYLSLTQSGKNVQVVSNRDPLVEVSNLVGIDQLKKSFDGKVSLMTVSFPLRGKAIQKVSYNTEKEWLHLNVFAGDEGLNFTERDVQFVKKGACPSLIFAFGIPTMQEVTNMVGSDGIKIVNIDTHPSNQNYGDIVLTDRAFSSSSEIVVKIIDALGLQVDIDIAQNLLDGLSFATRDFTSPNTSPYAFEATSLVMRAGARRRPTGGETRNQGSRHDQHRRDQNQSLSQGNHGQNQPRNTQNPTRHGGDRSDRGVRANFDRRNQQQNQQAMQSDVQSNNFSQARVDDFPINTEPVVSEKSIQPQNTEDVPQDWFEPKIFSGAKSPDEN